jgi:hypothetical protein
MKSYQNSTEIPSYPLRMAIIKKTNKNASKNAEIGERGRKFDIMLMGLYISTATIEINIEIPQKIKNRATICSW